MDRSQSLIGSYPSHWRLVELGAVADLKHGYQFRTYDFTDEGLKVFKITQIKSNGFTDISSCDFIDSFRLEYFKKFIIQKGDIVMALSGATIGKVARYKNDEIILQNYRVGNFLPLDSKLLSKSYFYYFLTSRYTFHQIIANQTQSAQENVGKEDILKMLLFLPPLTEQEAIASVLSSLDDKIDLLHRQNKTLEAMAETLFRQWFVEEAEEDWDVWSLGDIADINPIYQLKKGELSTYLEMKNVNVSTFNPKDWYKRAFTSGMKFKNGDTLLARITPCLENGKTCFVSFLNAEETGWGSTEYIVLRMKEPFHPFISYIIAKNKDFRDFAIGSMSGSSGRQRAQANVIREYTINMPSLDIIKEFNIQLNGILPKLKKNANQIPILEKLRDTLLPKLMSGEAKVSL